MTSLLCGNPDCNLSGHTVACDNEDADEDDLRSGNFDALSRRIAERNAQIDTFCALHCGVPFQAPIGPTPADFVIVHRDPTSGKWRTSVFDRKGPSGHYYDKNYRDSVRTATGEFHADLTCATFPSDYTKL